MTKLLWLLSLEHSDSGWVEDMRLVILAIDADPQAEARRILRAGTMVSERGLVIHGQCLGEVKP